MFKAKEIEITADGKRRFPLYALIGDRSWRRDFGFTWPVPSTFRLSPRRYRFVGRRPEYGGGAGEYARPWVLWAVLRLRQRAKDSFWSGMNWLYRRGIIHFRTPETMRFRWRDLGLGPDPRMKG